MFAVRLRRTASALHLVRDVYVCGSISTNNCASGFHSKRNIQVAVENVRNSDRGSDKLYRDRLKVTARAGDGGAGCVSFWQSTAKGRHLPADGGDGGAGGDVIIRASTNMKSLAGIPQLVRASHGMPGSRQEKRGRQADDTILLVPLGTVVSRYVDPDTVMDDSEGGSDSDSLSDEQRPSNDDNDSYRVIADLIHDGDQVIAARGGCGGRGNAVQRARPNRPAPASSQPPEPGEVVRLLLELKLLADIAFVGFPNVGKSSLLRALTAATPRVGDYAFTTLQPQLGTVVLSGGHVGDIPNDSTQRITVADIPGLIQGAHANRGLGHRFLRHVERARALAFVVDVAGQQGLTPWDQVMTLRNEIGAFSAPLLERSWMVVANKMDLLSPKARTSVLAALRRRCVQAGAAAVVGVSATGGDVVEKMTSIVDSSGTVMRPRLSKNIGRLLREIAVLSFAPTLGQRPSSR